MKKHKTFLTAAILAVSLSLSGCVGVSTDKKEDNAFFLKKTSFHHISNWNNDDVAKVLPAFQKSCDRIMKKTDTVTTGPVPFAGTYADWKSVCATMPTGADKKITRAYFEKNFTPYQLMGTDGAEGLFTGYYEPQLRAEMDVSKGTPLYARPDSLISVDLGAFREDLKGEKIMGRLVDKKLVPFYNRADIEKGALDKTDPKTAVVAYVDDPVDAFFLQIQGSGQVIMPDGSVKHVGYDSANGQKYVAIGKVLVERGEMDLENVSMQSIRTWLDNNPDKARAIMNENPSFVFFREIGADGPLGAEGVALTPMRSLAVDRKKYPYGMPIYISAEHPENPNTRLEQLMIAQDTGGAIRGAVRGDVFWGAGDTAAHMAGIMKSKGMAWVLLPNTVQVPEKYLK